jgi:hypothetical protein
MLLEIASNAVRKTQIEVSIPDNIILPAFKLCIFSQNSGEPKAEKESLAITWGLAIDSVIRGTVFPSLSGTCSVIIVGISRNSDARKRIEFAFSREDEPEIEDNNRGCKSMTTRTSQEFPSELECLLPVINYIILLTFNVSIP